MDENEAKNSKIKHTKNTNRDFYFSKEELQERQELHMPPNHTVF